MKYLVILLLIPQCLFSQANSRMGKYWVYRERLKNYVLPGQEQGCGMVANYRVPSNYNDVPNQDGSIAWHDGAWQLGYWIGTLAMEYKLLNDNGQDVYKTKHDLFYAISALNFLDADAENEWGCGPNLNGFLMRDHVPGELANYQSVQDKLNGSWVPPPNRCRIKCITSAFNDYENHRSEMSQDHLVGLFIGLALVKKCLPENIGEVAFADGESSFTKEVQNISHRIITHLATHYWIYCNPCVNAPLGHYVKGVFDPLNLNACSNPHHLVHEPCIEEVELDVDLAHPVQTITNIKEYVDEITSGSSDQMLQECLFGGGAVAMPQAIGFAAVNKFIQKGSAREIPSEILFNSLVDYGIDIPLIDGYHPFRLQWNSVIEASSINVIPGNRLLFTLSALGNIWKIEDGSLTPTDQVASNINTIGQAYGNGWEHLILLHRLFYGTHYSDGYMISLNDTYYECLLDAAPCRGSNEYFSGDRFIWNCTSRLEGHGTTDQNRVAFSGLDYLFYFNLFCLLSGNQLNQVPYSQIPIKHLAPIDFVQDGAFGNQSTYHEFDLKNFMSYNTLTAKNYSIEKDESEGQGRVTFVSNNKIILKNGFTAKNGSYFHAYIDPDILPFNCSNSLQPSCENWSSHLRKSKSSNQQDKNIKVEKNEARFQISKNIETKISFPNPVKHELDVSIDLPYNSPITLYLQNYLGENILTLVQNQNFSSGKYNINKDLSTLSAGLYVLIFITDKSIISKKLVIEK